MEKWYSSRDNGKKRWRQSMQIQRVSFLLRAAFLWKIFFERIQIDRMEIPFSLSAVEQVEDIRVADRVA